jgi:hypothetical protein
MKKLFLFIPVLCLLSFQPVNAQLEKGRIMGSITSTVGLGDFGTNLMNLGFTTEKIKYSDGDVNQTYKTIGFNLLPKAGIFIMDNLAIGADLLVNYHHQKSTDSDYKDTESMIAVGPFARYYFPLGKFYPFAEANVDFGFWKEKWSDGSNGEDKESLLLYGLGIGAAKSFGNNVMIDALVGYSAQTWKDQDNDKYIYGTIGLRVGITLLFGSLK